VSLGKEIYFGLGKFDANDAIHLCKTGDDYDSKRWWAKLSLLIGRRCRSNVGSPPFSGSR
jgi:hypothetical protein